MAFAAIPAGLSTLLTIASVGVGIAGVVASTSATIQANNYQAQIAERNRQLMEINAQRAVERASLAQQQQDEQTKALLGQQIAAQSASGLSLYGGSAMLTRKSARELGRMDAIRVKEAGDIEAFNYRMAAADALDQIKFYQSANSSALLSGFLDAASVGITGLRNMPPTSLSSLLGGRKVSATGSATGGLGVGGTVGGSIRWAS